MPRAGYYNPQRRARLPNRNARRAVGATFGSVYRGFRARDLTTIRASATAAIFLLSHTCAVDVACKCYRAQLARRLAAHARNVENGPAPSRTR